MKEKEIKSKYPDMDIYELTQYLKKNRLDYSVTFSGSIVVDEEYVESYIHMSNKREEQIAEEKARQAEEDRIKKKAMAQMLITSGFNFDGYTIKKYSGYISGDDAMTVQPRFFLY